MDEDRAARAERLAPWFALQLRLAEALAARSGEPIGEAVGRLTNLHRQFGLGTLGEGPLAPLWSDYVARLEVLPEGERRVSWTRDCFFRGPVSPRTPENLYSGCFSCEPPDEEGAVKIHFSNEDSADGVGPLSGRKTERRFAELRALFAQLRKQWPKARSVRGGSWLYNLDAYRRLFPEAYGDSRTAPTSVRLNGTSSWGQLIDHSGQVKPDVARTFLANLEQLNPERPWLVFPLRALATRAPIEPFYQFYDV
ncbi:MAG TPA: hypothetical protein VK801_18885 [Caulobacteraceae bacterium]|jgi:hypothetical protein|nr:hypothetical protein [Caulobacteraceae bacterium]